MTKNRCPLTPFLSQEILAKTHLNGVRKTIYSVNGDSYTGEWKDNKKHGRGIQKWKAEQLVYEGYWENGKRCGPGILAVVGNGRHTKIYSGMWKDNKRHGYGENWYSCNEFYEGEWRENKRSGWGRYYYKDGAMYEGEWLHDKRWGNGMLRLRNPLYLSVTSALANENRYEGDWIDDMKNGKGKYIFHTTNQVMEGIWIDDVAKQTIVTDLGPRLEATKTTYPIPDLEIQSVDAVWRNTAEENMRLLREKYPQDFK
ncbi:MORN repeat-containing protein 3 [Taenia solium]|eukprot:TsM_000247800 transcript=TsM_000247800 gene=TsM_000247800